MGVVIPPGYGQATLKFACSGVLDPMVVTMGYDWQDTANPTASPTQNAAYHLGKISATTSGWCHPSYFSNAYTFLGVSVVENRGGNMEVGEAPAAIAGVSVSDTVPPNCAVLVRKLTSLGGRHGRGRMYLPAAFTNEVNITAAGFISAAAVTGHLTRLEDWRTGAITAGLPLVLLHGESTPTVPPTPITGFAPQMLLATQRRRMR